MVHSLRAGAARAKPFPSFGEQHCWPSARTVSCDGRSSEDSRRVFHAGAESGTAGLLTDNSDSIASLQLHRRCLFFSSDSALRESDLLVHARPSDVEASSPSKTKRILSQEDQSHRYGSLPHPFTRSLPKLPLFSLCGASTPSTVVDQEPLVSGVVLNYDIFTAKYILRVGSIPL